MKNEVNKEAVQNLVTIREYREPPLYQVIIHNDDFTPMEFVVGVLEKFFYLERRIAAEIMYEAHRMGHASCGVFSRDLAESKVAGIRDYVKMHEHSLLCSMEAEVR